MSGGRLSTLQGCLVGDQLLCLEGDYQPYRAALLWRSCYVWRETINLAGLLCCGEAAMSGGRLSTLQGCFVGEKLLCLEGDYQPYRAALVESSCYVWRVTINPTGLLCWGEAAMSGGRLSPCRAALVESSCYVWRETINPAGLLVVGSSCYVWRVTTSTADIVLLWHHPR